MSVCAKFWAPQSRGLRAAIAAAAFVLTAGGAAQAQGFARTFFDEEVLPPRVVAWRLADRGFTGLTRPRFDGRFYIVDAVSPAGMPVRLVLEPANGAIVGRERLPGQDVYARLERPPMRQVPGYGWTEEDAERPPAPIPTPLPASRGSRRPASDAARSPETNPLGLNPEGAHRPEPSRKIARTSPNRTLDKTPPLISPAAPAPKIAPEIPNTGPSTPAANAKPEPEKAAPAAEAKPVAQAAPKQDWKDPPAEGKRPVRIIGGATIVPGTPDKDGEAPPQ